MHPEGWEGVRRVLAVRLDNIGDVVMLGPALRTLRRALPDASITLMASPAGSQVAPLLPWIDGVITHRAVWQDASSSMPLDPEREQGLVASLREQRFDAAVIFTSFSQSPYPPAYACYLAGIPIRLGQARDFGGSLLSHWVRPLPDDAHQVDRNLHLLEAAGFASAGRNLELWVPAEVQAAADGVLRAAGIDPAAPFVVIAPGASCAARRYALDRFAAVARMLGAADGLPMVVVGSARETGIAAPILEACAGRVVSLVGQTSVPELAAVIRRAALVLANNSGPMHFADVFGRPVAVLYSGTEYESQWRPRGAPAAVLRRETDCSPCYRFECPYHMECLDIPPEEVAAAALELVRAGRSAPKTGLHPRPLPQFWGRGRG